MTIEVSTAARIGCRVLEAEQVSRTGVAAFAAPAVHRRALRPTQTCRRAADGDKARERILGLGQGVGTDLEAEISAADRPVQHVAGEGRQLAKSDRPPGGQPEPVREDPRSKTEGDGQRTGRPAISDPMSRAHESLSLLRELTDHLMQSGSALDDDVKRGERQMVEHRGRDPGLVDAEDRGWIVFGSVGLAGPAVLHGNAPGPRPAVSPREHLADHRGRRRVALFASPGGTVPVVPARAFPVIYAHHVDQTVAFYLQLGFEEHFRLPSEGEAGYVGLRRDAAELAIVTVDSPRQLIGLEVGEGPRFELFVYVDDVDQRVEELQAAGAPILRQPEDMLWGERVAYVADPEGNPVALAAESPP